MSARDVIADALEKDIAPTADVILAALAEAGFVVVPRVPTEKMVRAALKYIKDDAPCSNPHGAYKAMLEAANEQ